jgi:hypothetical protein
MKYNQLSRYGAIAKSLPFTFGKVFFVLSSSDAHLSDVNDTYPVDTDGVPRVYTTLATAYAAMTTNQNDICILDGNTTHQVTEQITVSKNRCHFIGLDYLLGLKRPYGQSSRVNYADGNATALPFMIKNIGVRNSFRGIKFMNNNTDAQVVGTVGEGGEYAYYENCEFYNSTNLDSNTVAELVLGGDSPIFKDCVFGSLADAVSGDKIRPAVLVDGSVVTSGAGTSRDVLFDGCRFWKKAGGTTTSMVKVAADGDIERGMEFHDCQFFANMIGAVPAVAIDSPTLTNARIILTGDTCASECTKIATATGVFNCTPARVATATIGIQTT